jgi:hypothetical protein
MLALVAHKEQIGGLLEVFLVASILLLGHHQEVLLELESRLSVRSFGDVASTSKNVLLL